ncbi:MAG: HAMP domain-containing protein [Lachnospiraceae bacterium]|nr:HAMP domain-containing protein [Lachnospiraceae bacterium]
MSKKNGGKSTNSSVAFIDSIKTKLIVVMILVTAVPLIITSIVSYVNSTKKAMADAQDVLEWQAWYIEDAFAKILETNMAAMRALATAPSTVAYINDPSGATVPTETVLTQLNAIDEHLGDGNITVITGADGMQIIRSRGDCVDVSEREYFKQAMAGKLYVSDLIVSKSTGARQITIAVPIFAEGSTTETIGIVQRNYELSDLHEFLAAESDDAFVTDRNGDLLAHAQYEYGEGAHEEENRGTSEFMTSGKEEGFYSADTGKGYSAYIAYVHEPLTGFSVVTANNSKIVLAAARSSAVATCIVGVIMLIIAIVISFLMAKSFTDPIHAVQESLAQLADGRFAPVQKYDRKKDEFGMMSRAMNSVIEHLSNIVANIKRSAVNVGESSEELSDMADQISQTTEDVSNAVQQIASGATQQADEIQSASENVGKIGDAVHDVQSSSGTLQSLAGKMKEASEVSSKSLEALQTSSSEMTSKIDDITHAIEATQNAVSNINEKVEGISSIASQTNLLSLNASIEAARAGEAGRGFAVVAEEIGKLADDSRIMAEEIRKEMDVLLEQSNAAVGVADEVRNGNMEQQTALGETIDSISGMIGDINDTVGGVQQISEGATTCDNSKDTVVDAMSALSAISQENAASSEETGASMEELSATVTTLAGSANNLKDIAKKLNEEMEFFKN